jgi:hypothetical protein
MPLPATVTDRRYKTAMGLDKAGGTHNKAADEKHTGFAR